jgi:hypothetical protein
MTRDAQKHLASAKRLIASGELYYKKAAKEILAAKKADTTLGDREIGEWFGRSHTWVQDIVRWSTTGKSTRGGTANAPTPYAEQSGAVAKRHTKSVLREASAIEIAALVRSDPKIEKKVVQVAAKIAEQKDTELRQRVDAKERKIHGNASQDRVQKHEREIGFLDDLHSARSRVLYLVKKLHDLELSDEIAEECAELFDDMRAAAEMGIAFLDKGERFDDELAELLAEGQ